MTTTVIVVVVAVVAFEYFREPAVGRPTNPTDADVCRVMTLVDWYVVTTQSSSSSSSRNVDHNASLSHTSGSLAENANRHTVLRTRLKKTPANAKQETKNEFPRRRRIRVASFSAVGTVLVLSHTPVETDREYRIVAETLSYVVLVCERRFGRDFPRPLPSPKRRRL